MTKGKTICSVLKTIRKQVADANEIKYEPRECHHQGEFSIDEADIPYQKKVRVVSTITYSLKD